MNTQEIIQYLIIAAEACSAIAGILYYHKLKNTYWKYFAIYCIVIFLNELFSLLVLASFIEYRQFFYDVYGIPIQFLFLFWLYAYKSLQMKTFFFVSIALYLISLIPHFFYEERYSLIPSMSYTVGCFLILIMCVLEFVKQVKSDSILYFKQNKMFYINIGVILFYVGTMPFFAFIRQLHDYDIELYRSYRTFT
ncbi:MAG: hypothetical protein K2P85_00315, partial [Flavobacteriaceae bacterium]|nr:hypothetical protein [Flavobacteriaceae bacterium]